MRHSTNEYKNNRLYNGFDYENQAWVLSGRYIDCGHPDNMNCGCYGRLHIGETPPVEEVEESIRLW